MIAGGGAATKEPPGESSLPRDYGLVVETRFNLQGYLEEGRLQVDGWLAQRVESWREAVPLRLVEAMGYSLLGGGKRLRPLLCLAAFEGCGGELETVQGAVAREFAEALELVHTYSLIHDDLPAMDDDDLRRGRPTCHRVYGEATAILAGDALLTEAFGIVAAGGEPVRVELVRLLAQAAGAAGMVGGQQLDLEMEGKLSADGPLPSLESIEAIHGKKTGALLTAAAKGGALAAGAPMEWVEALRSYGRALGLAFQIADDVLDVVGDADEMGKSGRGDEAKGKPTYAALVGIEESRRLGRIACEQAIDALEPLGAKGDALRSLARYAIERAS